MSEANPQPALERLRSRVAALASEAGARLGIDLPVFEVRADLRGVAAGRCQVSGRPGRLRVRVRFNARVLGEAWLFEEAMAETAPHEVAHGAISVLALSEARRLRPHGPEWLALCRELGGSGRTTHQLPLQRARRHREFEYRLDDGERVWLGAVRHRRLQDGRAGYFHRRRPVRPDAHTGRWRFRQ